MPTTNGKSLRLDSAHDKTTPAVVGVVGVVGTSTNSKTQASPGTPTLPMPVANDLVWDEDAHATDNYAALGKQLAKCNGLFRGPEYGLIVVRPGIKRIEIMKGADLFPIVVDRVRVTVIKDGKNKGSQIPSAHLNAMLKAEMFLRQFQAVDLVTKTPMYLPDFTLTKPGYNDGGPGNRIIYDGVEASSSDSMDTINKFLDVMAFDTTADKTNAVAAALTVCSATSGPVASPSSSAPPRRVMQEKTPLFASPLALTAQSRFRTNLRTGGGAEFRRGREVQSRHRRSVIENARLVRNRD